MNILKQSALIAFTAAATMLASAAWADSNTPVGLWRNVDDVTGKPRAVVRITEAGGTLQGKVEQVFLRPNESPTCIKCEGSLRNVPVVGLVILSGLKKDGDEYTGGKILDPDSGRVYSSSIKLIEKGNKLNVRGFLGISALGRTQTWERLE